MNQQKPGAIPSPEFVSLFTHAHQVIEHVYLGDYRAFLSTDPAFVQKHGMVDSLKDIFIGDPTQEQKEWAKNNLDNVGCSDKNIKHVVSVTKFEPGPKVPEDDWSRFQPDLKGILLTHILVDDDGFAWELIEPMLNDIFEKIDHAIQLEENILIHCVKGASRSATVLCAYLINRCHVTVTEAFNFIQSIRHQVELKPSMKNGLEDYQKKMHNSV